MNRRSTGEQDVWVYRISVLALGLAVLSSMVGGIVLSAGGRQIPEAVVALGSAAIGSLAGLLIPSPISKR